MWGLGGKLIMVCMVILNGHSILGLNSTRFHLQRRMPVKAKIKAKLLVCLVHVQSLQTIAVKPGQINEISVQPQISPTFWSELNWVQLNTSSESKEILQRHLHGTSPHLSGNGRSASTLELLANRTRSPHVGPWIFPPGWAWGGGHHQTGRGRWRPMVRRVATGLWSEEEAPTTHLQGKTCEFFAVGMQSWTG